METLSAASIHTTEVFTIRTSEVNADKHLKIPALLRLLDEAAMRNVMKLRVSVWDLELLNLSWVLTRKSLKINRLPRIGETLRVFTSPSGFDKLFTFRDYKVFDEADKLVAWSSSAWLMMDTQKRRLTRIPERITNDYGHLMPDETDCLPRPLNQLPKLKKVMGFKNFKVNFYDLDFNNHLNNVLYVSWMLETLPDELLRSGTMTDFHILYRSEARWHDEIRSEIEQVDANNYLHRLTRVADEKEIASATSTWKDNTLSTL